MHLIAQKKIFLKNLIYQFDQISYDQVLMVGDFNGTVNNIIDRKGKRINMQDGKLPKVFFYLIKQGSMEDIWRKLNPKAKDFMFYL